MSKIIIYQAKDGSLEFKADTKKETIWANLDQISKLFGRNKSVISRHLKNIYKSKELDKKSTVAKIATVQNEGDRKIKRTIEYYNLDAIISVGYRVNSKNATQFRIWATKTLKELLTKGFVIDSKQIHKNYTEFLKVVEEIQNIIPDHVSINAKTILELIKEFSKLGFL